MKASWLSRTMVGLTVLSSAAAASAGAGGQQPFHAVVDVGESFIPTSTPGVFGVVLGGDGVGTHLGRLTFAATETIDFGQFFRPDLFPSPRALVTAGELTITAANGDQLTAMYDGYGVPDPSRPGFFNGYAIATLTGGTGRFGCASGTVPFTLDINSAALTEVITFDGAASLFCKGHP